MSPNPLRLGSICTGYGGLEMGIAQVLATDVAWVADYEPPVRKKNGAWTKPTQGPARILAHRYPGVPNLGDITKVDWATTAPVDIIAGGTPCQDVSHAGARAGMRTGTRSGIWSSMVEAIAHHRPALVVWENVRGVLSAEADSNVEPCPICVGDERDAYLRALGRVLGDLAELGYDAVWAGLPASAVGAPHPRYRVFVLAWPAADAGSNPLRQQPVPEPRSGGPSEPGPVVQDADGAARGQRREPAPGQAPPGWARAHPGGRDRAPAAHPDRPGPQGPQPAGRPELPDRGASADPDGGRREPVQPGLRPGQPDAAGRGSPDVDWGRFAAAVRRWEPILGRPAPLPRGVMPMGGQGLSPAFAEWMMGLPAGHVTEVPGLSRDDQLKAIGNGAVPLQVAAAVRYLLQFLPGFMTAGHLPPKQAADESQDLFAKEVIA